MDLNAVLLGQNKAQKLLFRELILLLLRWRDTSVHIIARTSDTKIL